MKKIAFISFSLLVLVILVITVGKCVKTIKEFNSFETTENTTKITEKHEEIFDFSTSVQIEDFIIEVVNGKIAYDENEKNIIYEGEEGFDFVTFYFTGAVINEMIIPEVNEYVFSEGKNKINVPRIWQGTVVKEVKIELQSEECGEIDLVLKRWS